MIILDANLLIYAVNEDARMHRRAKAWLEKAVSGTETVGLSWTVLLAFLRLTTRPGLFRNPLPIDGAFNIIDAWLEQRAVTIIDPGPRHAILMRELLSGFGAGGNLMADAHLAALALEHHAELYSCDHDFERFPGLKWRDPLA